MALTTGTYEAGIIELLGDRGDVIRYTVADATAISKGSLMRLTDPRTCIKNSASMSYMPVAGIASADKVANDGSTSMGCYTHGIFELRTSEGAGLLTGDSVCMSGANNEICLAREADTISGGILGKALETATSTEEIAVLVNCG